MTPAFEKLQKQLKQLPGLGYRSSERIALHLLVEKPGQLPALVSALQEAARAVKRCARCGNLAEDGAGENDPTEKTAGTALRAVHGGLRPADTRNAPTPAPESCEAAPRPADAIRPSAPLCAICDDPRRDHSLVCVVEHVPDLVAMERSGAYRGVYHVLHGKLSPINGVGPEQLNFAALFERVKTGAARELILALSNDIEGEATCHYLTQHLPKQPGAGAAGGAGGAVKTTRIGFGLPSGGGVLYADSVTLRNALEARREYA